MRGSSNGSGSNDTPLKVAEALAFEERVRGLGEAGAGRWVDG